MRDLRLAFEQFDDAFLQPAPYIQLPMLETTVAYARRKLN